jgi:hypothetical protein
LECSVEFLHDILQDVDMSILKFRKRSPYFGDLSHLRELPNALCLALFQSAVVEIAAQVERSLQRSILLSRWNQSVFESFYHG